MKPSKGRRSTYTLIKTIALLMPLQGLAQTLPEGFDLQGGQASHSRNGSHLQINQSSARAVIGWSSFDIGPDASVRFNHANGNGMTLNIIDGTTATLISGSLSADDSIYLINPHGLTITPSGSVNTGGAFVASTLSVNATDFINGAGALSFTGNGGSLSNRGDITASDVVMLGSRVANEGSIIVTPTGKVALASGSQATLDLHGGGFLQVLAPASVSGSEALVSNTGEIVADSGLIQLHAATAQTALRETVYMPGVVRAQTVSGADGAIVFHSGDGGIVNVSGGTIDTSPQTPGDRGGQVEIAAAVLLGGVEGVSTGPRGQFRLAVDFLDVNVNSTGTPDHWTQLVENISRPGIRNMLVGGTDVSIQTRDAIQWNSGIMMGALDLHPGANGRAGNLNLYAGTWLNLGGVFSTYNADWTLSAAESITMFDRAFLSQFVNDNGHLRLHLRNDGQPFAEGIDLPQRYSGAALTATIDPTLADYDYVDIRPFDSIDVAGDLTLSGHLRPTPYTVSMTTLSASRVNWTTETTGGRLAGGAVMFMENGVPTRIGIGGINTTAPGIDAVRLELGSSGTVARLYGDGDPDQSDLGDHLFSVAAHNTRDASGLAAFGDLLTPGSLAVSGPGVAANVGVHALSLSPTATIAVTGGGGDTPPGGVPTGDMPPGYVLSGDMPLGDMPPGDMPPGDMPPGEGWGGSAGYLIDLSPGNPSGASVNLDVTPRPLQAEYLDPSYIYGSPQAALRLTGVVNNDEVRPLGTVNDAPYNLVSLTGGYGAGEKLNAGSHTVSVVGIGGADAGNYSFNAANAGQGTLRIDPKVIHYAILDTSVVYNEQLDVWTFLDGLLIDDDVSGDMIVTDNQGQQVDPDSRLSVGAYQLKFFGLSGPAAGNYQLSGDGNYEGTLTITPRPITWSIDNVSSVYGTLAELGTAHLTGVLPNDEVMAPVTPLSPLVFNSPVGSYQLGVSGLAGSAAGNYMIASSGHRAGRLIVTPKPLTWQSAGGSSEYGTLPVLQNDVALIGVLPSDDVSATSGLRRGGVPVTLTDRLAAGDYTVHAMSLQGADAANYSLSAQGYEAGQWQITPRLLTWSVNDWSIDYGSTTLPNSRRLEGVLLHDSVTAELGLTINGDVVAPDGPRLPVGDYDVIVQALGGSDSHNYALAAVGNTPGTLTIRPRQLTWTLDPASRVYGQSLQTIGSTLHGVLSGDHVQPVISALQYGLLTDRPDVGQSQSVVTELTGRDAANYQVINPTSGVAGNPGALTITPRALYYSAGVNSFTYGEQVELDFTVSGLLEGDELPVMEYVLMSDGQVAGTGYSGNFFVPSGGRTNAGSYTIEPRFLRGNLDTTRNYVLQTEQTTPDYISSGWVFVNPKPLDITLRLQGARQVEGQGPGNYFETQYLTFGVDGNGMPMRPMAVIEGALIGDDVAVQIREPDLPVSRQGYYQVGDYSWGVAGLSGADAGNYTTGASGLTRLSILPREIFFRGSAEPIIFGTGHEAAVDLTLRTEVHRDILDDALSRGHISINPQAVGFEVEYDGVTYHEWQPQRYLPVGQYDIAMIPGQSLFTGPDAFNFAPRVIPQGRLVVHPKELIATPQYLELTYGATPTLDDLFTLSGVLPGTQVSFNHSAWPLLEGEDGSRLQWRQGSLLDAGDYTVTPITAWLTGFDARNYVVTGDPARLLMNQRPLYVEVDESLHYGTFELNPVLKGMLEEHEFIFFDRHNSQYVLSQHGERVDWATHDRGFARQPEVGTYTLDVEFSGLSGRALRNYALPPQYTVEVVPRPLWVGFIDSHQSYGEPHETPFDLLYQRDAWTLEPGIVAGDDVSTVFGVYESVWEFSEGRFYEDERTFDEYLPVGNYRASLTGLSGSMAHNYVLDMAEHTKDVRVGGTVQPLDYYREVGLRIYPKRLTFGASERPGTTTYGDAVPLAALAGVLPDDELTVITQRGNRQLEAAVSGDLVLDTTAPSVGDYSYALTRTLGGSASRNYELTASTGASATIVPREVVYSIDNVIGQYGNLAGCTDPSDPYLCTYTVDSDGVGHPDIWAPLKLGQANLFNWIEGDNVSGNVILINPLDNSTLTLDDKPVPGTYLQVVDRLTGRDAHNYRIAETGSSPGILSMQPRWVQWRTFNGFFSTETGIVTFADEFSTAPTTPARASLNVSMPQGVDVEHRSGLTPVVKMLHNGTTEVIGDVTDSGTWRWVRQGVYTPVVVDLEGEYADYYRPLPPQFLPRGQMGFFTVTALDNHEVEIDSAILERRAQQIEAEHAYIMERYRQSRDGLPPPVDEAVDQPPPDTNNLTIIPDGYADVLFEYGITGVTLEAGAGGDVEVEYQFGPGYVRAGAEVDAAGRLQFNYRGVEGSGSVRAGLDAGTGVSGGVGDFGTGSANLGAEANAFAKASFTYTFEEGRFVYRTETMTGAGASANAGLGLEGQYGSANVKTTIYSPGTVGAGFAASGGYDDGVLSFNMQLSLGLGLFGGSINFGASINLLALADGLEEAGRWIGRAVTELGCQIGIGSCSNPTPAEIYQRNLARGNVVSRNAGFMRNGSPAERYQYLKNNPEWAMAEVSDGSKENNRRFFNTYASMMDDLREFQQTQERLRNEFEQALASGDTRTATQAMTNMTVWNSLDGVLDRLNEKGRDIGVAFRVRDGEIVPVSIY